MKKNFIDLVDINKNEVLRYLEYKGQKISNNLNDTIGECIQITTEKINPRYILRVYPISRKHKDKEYKVFLEGTNLVIKSRDVYELLSKSEKCIIMASTLGIEIEKEIKKYSYCELTKSIIIDACATTAIEDVCDIVQQKAEEDLNKSDYYITDRYSPGYGDLPIETNRELINILSASKEIGLTITEQNIMIPRKSVIAIMGITKTKEKKNSNKCLECSNYRECKYKKGDKDYECKRIYKR